MDTTQAGTKTQFSQKMEFEYKSIFASVGAKYESGGGTSVKQETKTTSTAVEAKGGSQDIVSIHVWCLRTNVQDRIQRMASIHPSVSQGL